MKLEQVRFRTAVLTLDGRSDSALVFRNLRDGELTPHGRMYEADIDLNKRVVNLTHKNGPHEGRTLSIPIENVQSFIAERPAPSPTAGPGRGHKRTAEEQSGVATVT